MKGVKSEEIVSLIRKFLVSGIMIDNEYRESVVGTPQGGNLSPLLSNIVLNELDKEMEANPSNYGLLNELTNEKEALEEELLYKYERVEYLEDLAKKIEEYKKK